MNTYRLRMPKRRKHMSATLFGTAAIALAIGGLAQPAVSHAEWDIAAYDECLKTASVVTCCAFSGCPGGGGGFGSFGYCDGPTYPDGSYDHTVAAMGGWISSRVCPPDPGNPTFPLPWIPGQMCQFRK